VTPIGLRAPELVLKGELNMAQDIWSFGCLIFELIAGRPLFYVFGPAEDDTMLDDEHLLEITDRLGQLPDELSSHWKTSSRYFTKDGTKYNCMIGGVPEGREPLMLRQSSMEQAFDEESPEMTKEEANEIKKLIRWIFHYDPAKRPSAKEILCHPWFAYELDKKAQ
jgi:non-specific serine/threonine protein kinase